MSKKILVSIALVFVLWANKSFAIKPEPVFEPNNITSNTSTVIKNELDCETFSHINSLPKEILIQIFNTPGTPKSSGTVCKYWEHIRTDPSLCLKVKLDKEEDFLKFLESPYKKPKLIFTFTPTTAQLQELTKRLKIQYLNLGRTNVTDVSMLGEIHTLNLTGCRKITDVSMLGGVHTLDLSNTQVTDVSMLGRVYKLCLVGCENIKNVSMLGGIHTLNLSHTEITDVSMLDHVHTLNLSHTEITDVSKLGHAHTLNLACCNNIGDVSMLGNIHTLNLAWCKNIGDVSMLGNVHTLNLSYTKITDVSMLGGVHTLNLKGTKVTDFSAVKNIPHLIRD